jgi:hypothetical protein
MAEKGHAYLRYQNGVVFVSDKPFSQDLVLPKDQ